MKDESKVGGREGGRRVGLHTRPKTDIRTSIVGDAGQVLGALLHQGSNKVLGDAAQTKAAHAKLAACLVGGVEGGGFRGLVREENV